MHRHDRGEMTPAFLSLCLIGFGAHFGVALIQIGFIGCVILGFRYKTLTRVDRRLIALVCLFGVMALSHSLLGQEPLASADYLLRWRYLLLLPLVPILLKPPEVHRLLGAFVVLTGISALYGIAQVIFGSPGWLGFLHPEGTIEPLWRYVWSPDQNRWIRDGLKATGTIHNIAAFAHTTMLVMLWPLASGLLSRDRVPPWQILAGLLALAALSLSGARAAWLGFGAGTMVLILCRWQLKWFRATIFSLLLLIGGLGVGLLTHPGLQKTAGSLTGRASIWTHCLQTAKEAGPYGLGYGTHAGYSKRVYPRTPGLEKTVRTWCHHLPLSLAVEAPFSLIPAALLMILLVFMLTGSQTGALEGYALACIVAFWTIAQLHDPHFQREFFPIAMLMIGCGLVNKEAPSGTDGR